MRPPPPGDAPLLPSRSFHRLPPGTVEKFEAEFKAKKYPTMAEIEADLKIADHKSQLAAELAKAKDVQEESRQAIVKLKERIALLESKKTTTETTAQDILDLYPEIEEEIDEEIHNHQWMKDTC